jgi:tripartite-type tricarboxylate transporter receptor subunit TctC
LKSVLLEDASDDRERRSVRAKPKVVGTHLAPGAGSDTVARITAEKMSEGLSQPVVVENRSGAGGMLANRYVAGAAPDGYTLLLVTGAYPAQAAVLKELSFDPLKDISMISLLMEYPFVQVARPDAPY